MTDLIRDWIIGITCGAMMIALLQALMPEGGIKKVGKLMGGLVLVAAVVQPLLTLDPDSLSLTISGHNPESAAETGDYGFHGGELLKAIIEEETEAYILDKAKELGITCTVEVFCEYDGETGLFYPNGAVVSGALTESQQTALGKRIEEDLAIPVESQTYTKAVG